MKSVFYTFIVMFLVAVSCTNGKHEFKSLDQAMETRPDSVLKRLDELSSSYSSMSKSEKMHYILLKAEAMNKLFIPMDTLQHVDEMCDYYMSHGSSAEKLRANYIPEFGISDSRFSCYARFPIGAYYICPPNNMDGKMQNCKVQMKFTL